MNSDPGGKKPDADLSYTNDVAGTGAGLIDLFAESDRQGELGYEFT